MVEQMRTLTTVVIGLATTVDTMNKRVHRIQRSVNAIDGMQEDLISRWVARFGPSTGSSSRRHDSDDDLDDAAANDSDD